MISRARLRANRINGRKSKGPRTAKGKLRSSQNAVKHGLRATKFKPQFDEEQRNDLIANWLDRANAGEFLSFAHEIVDAQLSLKSIHRIWDQMLAQSEDERLSEQERIKLIGRLQTISLYSHRASLTQRKAVRKYEEASKLLNKTEQN